MILTSVLLVLIFLNTLLLILFFIFALVLILMFQYTFLFLLNRGLQRHPDIHEKIYNKQFAFSRVNTIISSIKNFKMLGLFENAQKKKDNYSFDRLYHSKVIKQTKNKEIIRLLGKLQKIYRLLLLAFRISALLLISEFVIFIIIIAGGAVVSCYVLS